MKIQEADNRMACMLGACHYSRRLRISTYIWNFVRYNGVGIVAHDGGVGIGSTRE